MGAMTKDQVLDRVEELLRKYSKQAGIKDRKVFLGYVNKQDATALNATCDSEGLTEASLVPLKEMLWKAVKAVDRKRDEMITLRQNPQKYHAYVSRLAEGKGMTVCTRCMGFGKSSAWSHTGGICYDCGGKGMV